MQYVEDPSGEPARRQARRHRASEVERHYMALARRKVSIVDLDFSLSTVAVEAFVNNAG